MIVVRTFRSADGEIIGLHHHDLFALVIAGRASVENQREAERWVIECARGLSSKMGLVVVIDAAVPMPEDAVRRELDAIYLRLSPQIRAVGYAIEGTGFHSAAVRAVLTGVNFVTRRPYPTHTTSDLRGALSWVLGQLERDPRRGEPLAVIDAFDRARADARSAAR